MALCIASGALFEVTDLADKKTTNLDLLAHFNGSKLHQKSKILNRFFSTKRIFFFEMRSFSNVVRIMIERALI